MAIKTILVHLAVDDERAERLNAAITIAKALDARLICLYVAAAVHIPAGAAGRGASAAYLAEATQIGRERIEDIKKETTEACSAAGIAWEWVASDTDHFDSLMEHVHRTDLTVLTQVQFDHIEDRLMFQLPEHVIREAGGPVLVLPKGKVPANLSKPVHSLIAWRFTKEAIRAVRDALPILHRSHKVTLLVLDPDDGPHCNPEQAVQYLAQHGITADLIHKPDSSLIGEDILDTAHTVGADRIIMGAYGRSAIREMLFTGPSRYVLGHTDIAVYMSH